MDPELIATLSRLMSGFRENRTIVSVQIVENDDENGGIILGLTDDQGTKWSLQLCQTD